MFRATMFFLQGEVAASSHGRKKAPLPWKQSDTGNKQNFKNKPTKVREEARQVLAPNKDSKRNFCLGKAKVQSSSTNGNSRGEKGSQQILRILRRFHQRAKTKRPIEGTKEGRNFRKGQAIGNPDGP
ncbi:hypothetical protein Tco_0358709, partial [Tanacetum coccineum]